VVRSREEVKISMRVEDLPKGKIPQHIALILDGNRRWARKKRRPDIEGHRQGVERIKPVVKRCVGLGVEHVTFWAFSTENWKRSKDFITGIMSVFRETLGRRDLFEELIQEGGEIHIFGDLKRFPEDIQQMVREYLSKGKPDSKRIDVNFALNYGGRDEILRAIMKVMTNGVKPTEVNEELFSSYLDTAGQTDPDFLIRTGGEKRLSGYLTWQSVYAELYFTDVYWPDFTVEEFDKAILDYARRERRFGGESPK
jgi:undecaprenyl diphosphate synthase